MVPAQQAGLLLFPLTINTIDPGCLLEKTQLAWFFIYLFFFAYLPLISLFLCCSCRKQGSREGGRDSELPDVCEDEATSWSHVAVAGWLLTCCCCCTHRGVWHTSAHIAKSRACKAKSKTDQPSKLKRRKRAAIKKRASLSWQRAGLASWAAVFLMRGVRVLLCVPCSPLVLHVWAL